MAGRNAVFVFGVGLLTGALGTIALTGGHAVPRALAQAEIPAQPAGIQLYRYQVAPWANPNGHGAYILDTATGEMWSEQGGYGIVKVGPAGTR